MAWAGKGREETPLPIRLIKSAMGLWTFVIRGQELPWDKVSELRAQTRLEDRQASKQLQAELRQLIGEMTLDGSLTVAGRTTGPMIMGVLCHPYDKNRRTLEIVLEFSDLLKFTLGGYNLKEITALALRADLWLEEMRGHNSPEDIEKRRRVEDLLSDLVEFIATTREENYELIERTRYNRKMAPAVAKLHEEMLREPSLEELTDEMAGLDNRVAESWGFLRRNSPLESPEVQELQVRIGFFEEALKKLERRVERLTKSGGSALEDCLWALLLEQTFPEVDPITPEEEKWREETEAGLCALRGRLWTLLRERALPEIDFILSAESRRDQLRAEVAKREV